MNNLKYKIIAGIILTILGMSSLLVSPVFANGAGDALTVDFENDPLFDQANFLPGQSVTRWVKVTNNSGESKRIATQAINVDDPDYLGNALILEIREEGVATPSFSGPLTSFFNVGEVYLSDLGDGGDTQYNFSVSFYPGTYNTLQGKSLMFDFLVGFQGEEGGVPPGSGSGSGGSLPPGFTILEDSIRVTNVQETSVTITWNTTYFSTSQVIYGAEGESHILDLNDTSGTYGYEYATPEYDTNPKVTGNHSVTIYGLAPETSYYFRCLSHASPPSISRGHSFVTLADTGETETGKEEGGKENWGAETSGGSFTYGGGDEQEGSKEGNKESAGIAQGSDKKGGLWASILGDEETPTGEKENLLDKTSRGLASMFSAIKGFLGRTSQSTFFVALVTLFLIALCLIGIRKKMSSKEEDEE